MRNFFKNLFSSPEPAQKRPATRGIADGGFGNSTTYFVPSGAFSAVAIDEAGIMGIPAFSKGLQTISKSIAAMPIHLYYQGASGERERVLSHPYLTLIKDSPNPFMTAETFRQTAQNHLLIHGNAFIKVVRNSAGRPSELYLLHPANMSIEIVGSGDIRYKHYSESGTKVYNRSDILHLRGSSLDGLIGQSTLKQYRRSLGIILAAETYGVNVFENGVSTNFFITMPESYDALSPEQLSDLRASWQSAHTGVRNAGKVAILPPGLKVETVQISAQELQLLETRQYHISEIARILNIQPHLVGDLSRATFGNIEQQSLEFLQHTINPWLVCWEQSLNNFLLGPKMGGYFFEFNRDSILRNDTLSRYQAHAIALSNGFLSIDEVRAIERLNPLPDGTGSSVRVPLNMTPAGTSSPVNDAAAEAAKAVTPRSAEDVLQAVKRTCFKTALSKCSAAIGNILKRNSVQDVEGLHEDLDKFFSTYLKYCERAIEPYNSAAEAAGHDKVAPEELYNKVYSKIQERRLSPDFREFLEKFIQL